MVQYEFQALKDAYESFSRPLLVMEVGGKDITSAGYAIVEADISLTCGYEASVASVSIANVFSRPNSKFKIDELKKTFLLGHTVEISVGYDSLVRTVFLGFISQISFSYSEDDMPLMIVTCMDIKGAMMSGRYNQQLKARDYSGAVKEIFEKTSLKSFTESSIYKLNVTDTPDHKEGGGDSNDVTAFSVEMVNETDYEFVVRAAKKFNYEFFCLGSNIYFRKARENTGILMEIGPEFLITSFNVEYNISGLARTIEVRGVNPDKGEVITGKRKISHKVSLGAKVNPIIKDSLFVYQDPTANSTEDIESRLNYLENDISRKFASLDMELIGIPELTPARFIELRALTSDLSKKFYITTVNHIFSTGRGYRTKIEGYANSVSDWQ